MFVNAFPEVGNIDLQRTVARRVEVETALSGYTKRQSVTTARLSEFLVGGDARVGAHRLLGVHRRARGRSAPYAKRQGHWPPASEASVPVANRCIAGEV